MSYRTERVRDLASVMPALERALDIYEGIVKEEAARGHFAATRERMELLKEYTASIVNRVQAELFRQKGFDGQVARRVDITRPVGVLPPPARRAAGARQVHREERRA